LPVLGGLNLLRPAFAFGVREYCSFWNVHVSGDLSQTDTRCKSGFNLSSGPAVPAGSGLTAPGLAKNKSPLAVSLLGPLPGSKNAVSFSSAATLLRGHYETKLTANSGIALWSSTNAVSISSARTMKHLP
jgi:hypothetical protein